MFNLTCLIKDAHLDLASNVNRVGSGTLYMALLQTPGTNIHYLTRE